MDRLNFLKLIAFIGSSLACWNPLAAAPGTAPKVRLGIDMLEANGFKQLRGQTVGLVTNHAGVNSRGESTIKILHTRARKVGVKLSKLFGPEHGIYGNVPAEKIIQNQRDKETGLPVYSLYGKTRKPTPDMLKGLTRMVVDLQDIGSRSYTYISCLRYVIEACFEADIPVIVLDRPNPLGGLKVDGPMLDSKWQSYVGLYPIPYVHGLTIGELALCAVRENWLTLSEKARSRGKIEVVKMQGWNRKMRWGATGLKWIPTSPYINSPAAAEGYAMTGLGTIAGRFQHTHRNKSNGKLTHPFRWLSFPAKKGSEIASFLNGLFITGMTAIPRTIEGREGAYVGIANWEGLRPCEISFWMMKQACIWNEKNPFKAMTPNEKGLFIKHVGSEKFYDALCQQGKNIDIAKWIKLWSAQARAFQNKTKKHWLYKI